MKTVHELAVQVQQGRRSTTSSNSEAEKHKQRTQMIFTRLTAQYGNTWASQLKDERMARLMLAEWTDGLRDFTDDQIERGLKNLESDFPPSLPAFKKECLTEIRVKAHEIYKPLPKPEPDPEKAEKAFSRIREIMSEAQ